MMKNNARWIQHTHILRKDEYECSACGYRTDKPSVKCPNCGSKTKAAKGDLSWIDEMEAADAIFNDR
ncbi:MAG: hypothetical protein IJJ44_08855 [Solobacterium sp.]|nr:hypothetical protein [Solobacterium sp.]